MNRKTQIRKNEKIKKKYKLDIIVSILCSVLVLGSVINIVAAEPGNSVINLENKYNKQNIQDHNPIIKHPIYGKNSNSNALPTDNSNKPIPTLTTPTLTYTPPTPISPDGTNTVPDRYNLVFSDEFNYPESTDPISNSTFASKWFYDSSICDSTWSGNNIQTDGNGSLVLVVPSPNNGGGIISSCDMQGIIREAFLYGYFEFRVRAPHTDQIPGIGWDIWLSGAYTWPPEIDLTESGSGPVNQYGGINQIMSTLHWAPDNQDEQDKFIYYDSQGKITTIFTPTPVDLSNDYHTYGLLWTPNYVNLSLDGVQIASWTKNIPQDYMFIIMSASNPGSVGQYPPNNSVYPAKMYVDYVRVYQKT